MVLRKYFKFRKGARLGTLFRQNLLKTLIAADLILILIHVLCGVATQTGHLERIPPLLSISTDWAIAEMFNYLKWVGIIAVLMLAYRRHSHLLLLVLTLVFWVILLDDSLQFHERFGEFLAVHLDLSAQAPKWQQAALEVVMFAVIGCASLLAILIVWPRSPKELKLKLIPAAVIMFIIICFGLFVDFYHSTMPDGLAKKIMGTVEDGGEMIGISGLLAYFASQFWHRPHQGQQDAGLLRDT